MSIFRFYISGANNNVRVVVGNDGTDLINGYGGVITAHDSNFNGITDLKAIFDTLFVGLHINGAANLPVAANVGGGYGVIQGINAGSAAGGDGYGCGPIINLHNILTVDVLNVLQEAIAEAARVGGQDKAMEVARDLRTLLAQPNIQANFAGLAGLDAAQLHAIAVKAVSIEKIIADAGDKTVDAINFIKSLSGSQIQLISDTVIAIISDTISYDDVKNLLVAAQTQNVTTENLDAIILGLDKAKLAIVTKEFDKIQKAITNGGANSKLQEARAELVNALINSGMAITDVVKEVENMKSSIQVAARMAQLEQPQPVLQPQPKREFEFAGKKPTQQQFERPAALPKDDVVLQELKKVEPTITEKPKDYKGYAKFATPEKLAKITDTGVKQAVKRAAKVKQVVDKVVADSGKAPTPVFDTMAVQYVEERKLPNPQKLDAPEDKAVAVALVQQEVELMDEAERLPHGNPGVLTADVTTEVQAAPNDDTKKMILTDIYGVPGFTKDSKVEITLPVEQSEELFMYRVREVGFENAIGEIKGKAKLEVYEGKDLSRSGLSALYKQSLAVSEQQGKGRS